MKYKSFNEAVHHNERNYCSVPGCNHNRYKISKHCRNHRQQTWRWGHPQARSISKKEYAMEIEEVSEIVNFNLDHKGMQKGIEFFKRAMELGKAGSQYVPCSHYFARLHEADVNPVDLLILSAAIWLFAERNPRRVLNKAHEDHLLGSKIIRFVPYHGNTKGPEHKAVGEYVRSKIGVLLLNINRSIKMHESERRETLKALNAPLRTA